MKVLEVKGNPDLALVYLFETADGRVIEAVESVQPPIPRREKWVVIVSTLAGCPVRCPICDAGTAYEGPLDAEEIMAQVTELVRRRWGSLRVDSAKFKVQFARMGDPAFNPAVLRVLEELPERLDAPGLMPCISTIAPRGTDAFFEGLAAVKRKRYGGGRFQMQFSLHTTDEEARRELVPAETWRFERMAAWGRDFFEEGDRKITLNFAAPEGFPMDAEGLARVFDPAVFAVKLTPVNPTRSASASGLRGMVREEDDERNRELAERFERVGFEVILSIGETEENRIGSNCGMAVRDYVER